MDFVLVLLSSGLFWAYSFVFFCKKIGTNHCNFFRENFLKLQLQEFIPKRANYRCIQFMIIFIFQ